MTSTEFAAKYRLLKNVATCGARSFLAQQIALGRMVMVHYLDSETPEQRAATLARLDALPPRAREKLLEVADVDGTPVAVTLFISSFVDFATWLDAVSPAAPAAKPIPAPAPSPGEFTRAFNNAERPKSGGIVTAPPPPAPIPEAPRKAPGEFTRIFGKVDEAEFAESSTERTSDAGTHDDDTPTVIMEAVKPHASPSPGPSSAASDAGSSFTAIFGQRASTPGGTGAPHPSFAMPSPLPPVPQAPRTVMPPPAPALDFSRPAAPPPPRSPDEQPGEFTQLFQRMSPGGGTPGSIGTASQSMPETQRPLAATPRADAPPPPLPAPAIGSAPPLSAPSLGTPGLAAAFGGVLPPPSLGNLAPPPPPMSVPRLAETPGLPNAGESSLPPVGAAPPAPWGAPANSSIGGPVFGAAAQSEYTRILGRVAPPPPPPVSIQPPAPAPVQQAGSKAGKSMMPLIIALNAVVLLTIVIVAYFVLRK